uniref:Uncharacterized protein AlNc14C184G8287 n=1 Tax=Albugo laibachii Nc14 TaxID=890382 RepID=F0WPE2_9STRA|nr:conserved hypothetical protein [Albugo laibachii Nc14]|eukprot:CCA23189.1 conserved hypothetical protein [Albugo laibachii Nc14]
MEHLIPRTTVKRLHPSDSKGVQDRKPSFHGVPIDSLANVSTSEDPECLSSKARVIQARVDELVRQFELNSLTLSDNEVETEAFENGIAVSGRWKVGDVLLATHRGLTQTCDRMERNMLSAPSASDDREVEATSEPATIQSTIETIDQVIHDAADKIQTAKQMLVSTHTALHLIQIRNSKLSETVRDCHAQEAAHQRHLCELKDVLEGLHNERAMLLKHLDKSFYKSSDVAQIAEELDDLTEGNGLQELHEAKLRAARNQQELEEAKECIQQLRYKVLELENVNTELRQHYDNAMQKASKVKEAQVFDQIQSGMESKYMESTTSIDVGSKADGDASQKSVILTRRESSRMPMETTNDHKKIPVGPKKIGVGKKPTLRKNSEHFQRHHKERSSSIDAPISSEDDTLAPREAIVNQIESKEDQKLESVCIEKSQNQKECNSEAKTTTETSNCVPDTLLASSSITSSFGNDAVTLMSVLRASSLALSMTKCKRASPMIRDPSSDCLLGTTISMQEGGTEKIQLAKAWMQRLIMRKTPSTKNHVFCQVHEEDLRPIDVRHESSVECKVVSEIEFVMADGLGFSSVLMEQLKIAIPQLPKPLQLTSALRELLFSEIVKYYKKLLSLQSVCESDVETKIDANAVKEEEVLLPEIVIGMLRETPFRRRKAAEALQKRRFRHR